MRPVRLCLILLLLLFPLHVLAEEALIGKVNTRKGSLNLRSQPTTDSKAIARIPNGTCILIIQSGNDFCLCKWNGKTGYCSTEFLTFLRNADSALLQYRVLRKGDQGEDVLALKKRLQELGYLRSGSTLSDSFNAILEERVRLFQRQIGATENGIASQELQTLLYSARAPQCTQVLPAVRSRVRSKSNETTREICGCCMGEGCECCNNTGWINVIP